MYTVSRLQASQILSVSVRTVDRYIASGKLSVQEIYGRVMLNDDEVRSFKRGQSGQKRSQQGRQSYQRRSVADVDIGTGNNFDVKEMIDVSGVDSSVVMSTDTPPPPQSIIPPEENSGKIYQKLYEELKQELKIKQERLEGANYRVGQLEAQLEIQKNETVPLLEYKKILQLEEAKVEKAQEALGIVEGKLKTFQNRLKEERLNKNIYLLVLFILLLLQPLWFIFATRF